MFGERYGNRPNLPALVDKGLVSPSAAFRAYRQFDGDVPPSGLGRHSIARGQETLSRISSTSIRSGLTPEASRLHSHSAPRNWRDGIAG